ncbi:MAG: hypothetical protein C0506_16725, partial [Anaerolinea sp.]|nr:hypothetical protein [Anaerolinea sp.]
MSGFPRELVGKPESGPMALLREAGGAVNAAEISLRRPTARALAEAAAALEEAIPRLRALEQALLRDEPPLDPGERATLAEAGQGLRLRIFVLGRLLEGAARLHAGWAEDLASRRGYSAEGVALP